MVDHNSYLTKLRWDTAYGNFTELTSFQTDAIVYKFKYPLTESEQNDFVMFLGDSDTLNSRSPVDFCEFFLKHRIEFTIRFKYNRNVSLKRNLGCKKIVKILNKRLEDLRPKLWHKIHDNCGYPSETCDCIIQTSDTNGNHYFDAKFLEHEKRFVSLVSPEFEFANVAYWMPIPEDEYNN
jgi:hypothetical protein